MNYLTSLRGIAALMIIFYHINMHFNPAPGSLAFWLLHNSYLAVDFFFVLSGFILAYKYANDFKSFDKTRYKQFLFKRLARIYPLHIFMLVVFSSIPLMLAMTGRDISVERYGLDGLLAKLLLVDAWNTGYEFAWNVPSWSISAEFLSYVCFPFIILICSKVNKYSLLPSLAVLAIILALFCQWLEMKNIGDKIGQSGAFRCVLEFSLGVLLYYALFIYKMTNPLLAKSVLLTGIGLALVCEQLNIPNYYYVPLCFTATLYGLLGFDSFMHRMLEYKPLVYLGEISYSVYLSHYFIRDFMSKVFLGNDAVADWSWIAAYVIITLIFSALSYRYVEVPGRRWLSKRLLKKFSI